MSSLVSDFIINPVLRQARRFSEVSRTTFTGGAEEPAASRPSAVAANESDQSENASSTAAVEAVLTSSPTLRPLSSSTEETRVDDAMNTQIVYEGNPATPLDHLGFPVSQLRKTRNIPEDDGMRELRSRIQIINSRDIPGPEKAKLMHEVLLEGYRASKNVQIVSSSPPNELPAGESWEHPGVTGPLESFKFWQNQFGEPDVPERFVLTQRDIAPTFAPIRRTKSFIACGHGVDTPSGTATPADGLPPLGCQHYERNVKSQCATCRKWHTCVFCHDNQEDHSMVRKDTRNMLCMLCSTPQKASELCINCGELAAQYFCDICKLWENRSNKPIYHCGDCGICRRGMGLGKDFVHCKPCGACIPVSMETSHKCIERSTDCDCPICGDYMFTSPKPVVFMPCGHSIHKKCYKQHMRVSYKCPICNKSLTNMDAQFRNLDVAIQAQPMPSEFRDAKAHILCNDCSGKSTVSFHWLGLKCSICSSYNTAELHLSGSGSQELEAAIAAERSNPSPEGPTAAILQSVTAAETRDAPGTNGTNRRRHSSHVAGFLRRNTIERSAVPGSLPHQGNLYDAQTAYDVDSEDDMLGFWRSGGEENGTSDQADYDSGDDLSDESEADDDDDEEEDNEILLIGHR